MAYLTEHEAIYQMNKIVLPLVKEDVVNVESKQSKGAAGKGGKGGKGKKWKNNQKYDMN